MAVKPKTTVKLRAKGTCPSHARSDISIRDLGFAIDEPTERGGTNAGPTPTDTVLAALIGCTNVIGHKCAQKLGVDIGHLDIQIESEFDRRGVTLSDEIDVPFVSIVQTVTVDGPATDADLARVAAEVEKFCPVSKLFVNSGTRVSTHWIKA